jgi:hypothetical protein
MLLPGKGNAALRVNGSQWRLLPSSEAVCTIRDEVNGGGTEGQVISLNQWLKKRNTTHSLTTSEERMRVAWGIPNVFVIILVKFYRSASCRFAKVHQLFHGFRFHEEMQTKKRYPTCVYCNEFC